MGDLRPKYKINGLVSEEAFEMLLELRAVWETGQVDTLEQAIRIAHEEVIAKK